MSPRSDSPVLGKNNAKKRVRLGLAARSALFFASFFPLVAFALVDINAATLAQLDTLKGIGPTKAQAIIDYRSANGPFYYIEDIMKVKGIGPVTYAGIKDDITVGNVVPSLAPPPAPKTSTPAASPKPSTPRPVSSAPVATTSATAPTDPYYPLVPWLMGLAAAFGLGIAGTLYLRPTLAPAKETASEAAEFEVE